MVESGCDFCSRWCSIERLRNGSVELDLSTKCVFDSSWRRLVKLDGGYDDDAFLRKAVVEKQSWRCKCATTSHGDNGVEIATDRCRTAGMPLKRRGHCCIWTGSGDTCKSSSPMAASIIRAWDYELRDGHPGRTGPGCIRTRNSRDIRPCRSRPTSPRRSDAELRKRR